ncbi:hypothetical protein H2248_008742 [Termitomyces sp. 'cryptogamus']|nr:hypothetical protein H2248_008742 [Termitomyces sp. 'cryptogamus']
MKLKRDNITVIPDDFDIEKTDFLNSDEVLDQFQNDGSIIIVTMKYFVPGGRAAARKMTRDDF